MLYKKNNLIGIVNMIIKNIFVVFIFSLFIIACSVNETTFEGNIFKKKVEVREPISNVLVSEINYILLLLKQNERGILNSKFINPIYGLYEVYKDETDNKITFEHRLEIDEISNIIESFDIKEEEPIFNCSPFDDASYGWYKEGVFLTPNTKPYLSELMKKANLIEVDKYNEEDIKRAIFIEKTSYVVTIPYNIIFYITKIDNQWYITLIDKVVTNCSQN